MYLNLGEDRVLLPNKYVPEDLMIVGTIDVFVYTDSEDRLEIGKKYLTKICLDEDTQRVYGTTI